MVRTFLMIAGLLLCTLQAYAQTPTTRDFAIIQRAALQVGTPQANATAEWARLLSVPRETLSFPEIRNFVTRNPGWPLDDLLIRRAEALMLNDFSAQQALLWFRAHPPQTGRGLFIYLRALPEGERSAALAEFWPEIRAGVREQTDIIRLYGRHIPRAAHLARFNWLLFNNLQAESAGIAAVLGQGYQRLAEARLALRNKRSGVNRAIDRVPANLQQDPGLLYERLRWRRQRDLNDRALEILRNAPPADAITNPRDWWRERHIMTRRLMKEGRMREAYRLASEHRQTEGFPLLQAEWVSGFLALRSLDEPLKAFPHFERLFYAAETSISQARGAYWAGRAAQRAGNAQVASDWYSMAARHGHTWYGQAAQRALGHSTLQLPRPPAAAALTQDQRGMIDASRFLVRAGVPHLAEIFFLRLTAVNEDQPQRLVMLARFARSLGLQKAALKIGKKLATKGGVLPSEAYPRLNAPASLMNGIEPALLFALIRQESQFDEQARSPVGALGLMQLMPATAQEVARKNNISHRAAMLTVQPDHNVRLGTLFLGELLRRYDGSLPLTLAAYNAGPGRVSRWLREVGDPRTGEISVEDWVERLDIYETRNYVQRILEARAVYQNILR